jgi:hypothetical protein
MSDHQYEIEQRMHDALAARDKRIEELLERAVKAESEVARLRALFQSSAEYDEPLYGDA